MVLKTVSSLGGGGGNIVSNITAGAGITLTPNPITSNGTVALTSSTITLGNAAMTLGNTTTSVGNLTLLNATVSSLSAPLSPSDGGTGLSSPGTTGNVLTSNGTAWISQAAGAAAGNVTYGNTTVALGGSSASIGNLTLNAPVINNPTGNVVPAIPAASIPNSLLANSTTTLGNTVLILGSTTSAVGNLTLNNPGGNVIPAIPPASIQNSLLANSSVTLGNTAVVLGSTVSTFGNLTTQNVIVQGFNANLATRTANVTLNNTDFTALVNTSSAAVTVTLPTAVGISGRVYVIKKIDSGANNVSIVTTSSQTIDGLAQSNLSTQNQGLWVQSDNANWWIVNRIDGRGAGGGTF